MPLGLSPYAVAKACKIPRTRIERLCREETDVSVDTAIRLGIAFRTGPEFWMNLQSAYDLAVAKRSESAFEDIKPLVA